MYVLINFVPHISIYKTFTYAASSFSIRAYCHGQTHATLKRL